MQGSVFKGPVQLPPSAERVVDADEEVFILYSELQSISTASDLRGLGYVDNHKDTLEIQFELRDGEISEHAPQIRRKRATKPRKVDSVDKTIDIHLLQDKTALHSRKGDTGSVLWKASIDFAQLILQQCYSNLPESLLPRDLLKSMHVLELGSGIGLLSVALSPLVRQFTATDIGPLVPLIRKNLNLNFPQPSDMNVTADELDWNLLASSTPLERHKNFAFETVDLMLAVDCIYHPSMLPSFVTTIDFLAVPNHTAVLIVSELRSEEVIRTFLELWLATPNWEIWRIPDLLPKYYVVWLGWKSEVDP